MVATQWDCNWIEVRDAVKSVRLAAQARRRAEGKPHLPNALREFSRLLANIVEDFNTRGCTDADLDRAYAEFLAWARRAGYLSA